MNIFKIILGLRMLYLSIIILLLIKQRLDYKECLVGFISIIFFSELLMICYILETLGEILIFISNKLERIINVIVVQIRKVIYNITRDKK